MQVEVVSTSSSRKSSAFHPAVHNETLTSQRASATKILWATRTDQNAEALKYAEQFEHDYDDDNYSNYVEDVSVHTDDSYQSEFAMARIFRTSWLSFSDRSGPFSVQAPET